MFPGGATHNRNNLASINEAFARHAPIAAGKCGRYTAAIMGLGFVLFFWAIAGIVAAAIAAVTLGSIAALLTRGIQKSRRAVIIATALFPFLCLGWGAAVFVFQAVVNEGLLHRDLGLGDTWHAPLPNGYQIMMIDVTDQGWVYNPKTQPESAVEERQDAIAGVRSLQIAGRYILGATDSKSFEHLGDDKSQVDGYFLLDTQLGQQMKFQSYDGLTQSARGLGIEPNLQPIYTVYSKFRFSWFDILSGILFLLLPVTGALLLIIWIRHLRRTRNLFPSAT